MGIYSRMCGMSYVNNVALPSIFCLCILASSTGFAVSEQNINQREDQEPHFTYMHAWRSWYFPSSRQSQVNSIIFEVGFKQKVFKERTA